MKRNIRISTNHYPKLWCSNSGQNTFVASPSRGGDGGRGLRLGVWAREGVVR